MLKRGRPRLAMVGAPTNIFDRDMLYSSDFLILYPGLRYATAWVTKKYPFGGTSIYLFIYSKSFTPRRAVVFIAQAVANILWMSRSPGYIKGVSRMGRLGFAQDYGGTGSLKLPKEKKVFLFPENRRVLRGRRPLNRRRLKFLFS